MAGFSFNPDWARVNQQLGEAAANGKLPGRLGLLQDIVGIWAIPKRDRNLIRFGKAAIDTVGAVYSYQKCMEKVEDQGRSPTHAWLRENGYERAVPYSAHSVEDFICKSLSGLDFTKKVIREGNRRATLYEFATTDFNFYFLPMRSESGDPKHSHGVQLSWTGPFVKPEDHDKFMDFVHKQVWAAVDSDGLTLSSANHHYDEKIDLMPLLPSFDFVGGTDTHNDLEALARRCEAFLTRGMDRKILFHGPPGTGKTTLARAIAARLKGKVVQVDRDAIKRMATSANLVLQILNPDVVIINDVDRAGNDSHHEMLEALETDKKGGHRGVLYFVTVNDIGSLDPALLRPGRIDEVMQVSEPSSESREMILDYYVKKFDLRLSKEERAKFIENSGDYSPADIRSFCEVAAAVGIEIAFGEMGRIREQRKLYAGDRCAEFNRGKNNGGRF